MQFTDEMKGLEAYADSRTREASYRMALKELESKIAAAEEQAKASQRKKRRDVAIHDHTIVRTYNFSRGIVHDNRTGKEAKDILVKAKLEKLR